MNKFFVILSTIFLFQCACIEKRITAPEITAGTVTGNDGRIYKTIRIGNQWWMTENLKETSYGNGDAIPVVLDGKAWSKLSTGALCAYDNNDSMAVEYGYLYNWHAVTDNRSIAPPGWHVPSDQDWTELEIYLQNNGYNYDGSIDVDNDRKTNNKIGKAMASAAGWIFTGDEGSIGNSDYPEYRNRSGLNILPGGYRDAAGLFHPLNWTGNYWSTTDYNGANAWYRRFLSSSAKVAKDDHNMKDGFSVRCVKCGESAGVPVLSFTPTSSISQRQD